MARSHVSYDRNGKVSSFTYSSGNSSVTRQVDTRNRSQIKNDNFKERSATRKRRLSNFSTIGGVLKVIIGILLLMLLFSIANGEMKVPSFSGLLNSLQSAPSFSSKEIFKSGVIPVPDISVKILGVNIFGWLQDIISVVVPILNFLIFLVVCASNVIVFIVWAVPILFGF